MQTINKEELHDIFNGVANSNETKFNELYDKYKKLVYAIAFSILKNRENCEEIVQIVFIKIWGLEKIKLPANNEASWLYSITKNETLNFLRSKKEEINIDTMYCINEENNEIDKIIEQDSFNRIISKLKRDEQEIVSLKILSDLSFKEIAQVLNKPIGTIQWKYYKAVHSLKILLSNLSMFIIAIGAIIASGLFKKKNYEKIEDIEQSIEGVEQEKVETDELHKEDASTDRIETDSIIIGKPNKPINQINQETQNIIIDNTIQNERSNVNGGVVSIVGTLLIVTLISLTFFIKHQQNRKKNVSK